MIQELIKGAGNAARTLAKLAVWRLAAPGVVNLIPPRLQVAAGPFAGLRYASTRAIGSALSAKLLGTYESELHEFIARVQRLPFRCLVDVGAAEGYYAIGLAKTIPSLTQVIAFEADATGREILHKMVTLNGESRIDIRGKCEPPALSTAIRDGRATLVLCDVEGYEDTLLDPTEVDGLGRCHILVETHDVLRPGLTATLRCRFRATHAITTIQSRSRTVSDFAIRTWVARLIPPRIRVRAVNEGRPGPMTWLWMEPLLKA
jgi:hypothetical protein